MKKASLTFALIGKRQNEDQTDKRREQAVLVLSEDMFSMNMQKSMTDLPRS